VKHEELVFKMDVLDIAAEMEVRVSNRGSPRRNAKCVSTKKQCKEGTKDKKDKDHRRCW